MENYAFKKFIDIFLMDNVPIMPLFFRHYRKMCSQIFFLNCDLYLLNLQKIFFIAVETLNTTALNNLLPPDILMRLTNICDEIFFSC